MKITKRQLRKIIREINTSNPVQINDSKKLLFQIAMKIKDIMPPDDALGMLTKDFRSMVTSIYEDHFDPAGEGWEPYEEDLAAIKDHLDIIPIPGDDNHEPAIYESKKMKITKRQLRRIIKEEKAKLVEAPLNVDTEPAVNQIEEILNGLSDQGVDNRGLYDLLEGIASDIRNGFVGEQR
jgi:hypothetical protein